MGQSLSKARAFAANSKVGRRAWSDLPDIALHGIVMKLSSPYAFLAFAGVCRSWRSVAKSWKHDFVSSQPPLILALHPFSPFKSSQFRIYSVSEKRFYKAQSPVLAQVLQNFRILGHSHGYLVAADKRTCAPALLNLFTQRMIRLPNNPPLVRPRGLLTSSIDSGNCKVLLYKPDMNSPLIAYYRVADRSKRWHTFAVPKIHGKSCGIYSVTVVEDRLYIGICQGYVMVVDISRDPFNVVRVIEHPSFGLRYGAIRVLDGELIDTSFHLTDWGRLSSLQSLLCTSFNMKAWCTPCSCSVQRLELSKMEEGNWVDGLGAGRSVFIEAEESQGYVWSGRMKGVEENCIYRTNSKFKARICLRILGNVRLDDVGSIYLFDDDIHVWVFPSDYEQWGFKGI